MDTRVSDKLLTSGCTLSVEEVDYINRMIADLKALVRDMFECVKDSCYECRSDKYEYFRHYGKPDECGNSTCFYRKIVERMKSLGVEP